MKRSISVLCLTLLFFLSQGSQCIFKKPEPEPAKPSLPMVDDPAEADKLSLALNNTSGTIGLKFNTNYFPANSQFLEVIFDGVYQGYFPVNDTVYIPTFTGRKQITVLLSDANGNKLSETRTYWIKL